MSKVSNSLEKIKKITSNNCDLLIDIIKTIKKKIKSKREVMYSDVINLIIREGYIGEQYSQLILWCTYNIRLGKTYLDFERKLT